MPPVNEVIVERVADCPESIVDGETEITGAVSVETACTVTVTVFEVTVTGVAAPSVTWSSNDHDPRVDSVPVGTDERLPAVHVKEAPRLLKVVAVGDFCSHRQV